MVDKILAVFYIFIMFTGIVATFYKAGDKTSDTNAGMAILSSLISIISIYLIWKAYL